MADISAKDIEALIAQFDRSEWRELHLQAGDIDLYLSKDAGLRPPVADAAFAPADHSPPPPSYPTPPPAAAVPTPEGWTTVRAPSLGTFYRAPKPGASPFVECGDRVGVDTEVCLLEVMKLFTTVRSGVAGTVREIHAQDGNLVEFDQPLFLVEPDA